MLVRTGGACGLGFLGDAPAETILDVLTLKLLGPNPFAGTYNGSAGGSATLPDQSVVGEGATFSLIVATDGALAVTGQVTRTVGVPFQGTGRVVPTGETSVGGSGAAGCPCQFLGTFSASGTDRVASGTYRSTCPDGSTSEGTWKASDHRLGTGD